MFLKAFHIIQYFIYNLLQNFTVANNLNVSMLYFILLMFRFPNFTLKGETYPYERRYIFLSLSK